MGKLWATPEEVPDGTYGEVIIYTIERTGERRIHTNPDQKGSRSCADTYYCLFDKVGA